MSRARPKSFSVVAPSTPAPMNRIDRMGRMATRDVFSDRIRTWFIDRFTVSVYVIRPVAERPFEFSSTLSNTTMVSYREYPRMVRKAITVAGVTSNREIE